MAKDVPKGKWALHWDACTFCGTNLIPHKADGLCERCYMWAYRQKQKMGFISRRIQGRMVRGKESRAKKPQKERKGMPKEALG
jgi:hypothetical protein